MKGDSMLQQKQIKMFQSPESTIMKSKYFKLNKEQPYSANLNLVQIVDEEQECFTPVLKSQEQLPVEELLRNSDRIQTVGSFYDHYLKNKNNLQKISPQMHSFDNLNPNIKKDQSKENIQMFITPEKPSLNAKFLQSESTQDQMKSKDSKQYLFINSPFQSYSDPAHIENAQILPNNAEALKYHIGKAKQQSQKLKDENLKLRLQKIKLATKTSKSETLKLIPLKIEYQKLKRDIEKLTKEKQILEMSKRIKENQPPSNELSINGMEFKVLKHIPGTNHPQKQLEVIKEKLNISNSLTRNNDDCSKAFQVTSQNADWSNFASSGSTTPGVSNNLSSFQNKNESEQQHSTVNSAKVPTLIRKVPDLRTEERTKFNINSSIDLNSQKSLSINANLGLQKKMGQEQTQQPRTGQAYVQNNGKASFLKFAKQSLNNGAMRPTFHKAQKGEQDKSQQLSSSSNNFIYSSTQPQLTFNRPFEKLHQDDSISGLNGNSSYTYGKNTAMECLNISQRPNTSVSYSPRTKYS